LSFPTVAIIDEVYDSFGENFSNVSYLAQCAIVCPPNKVVDAVHDLLFSMVPGDAVVFDTYDAICKTMDDMPDADLLYPPEFCVRAIPLISHGIVFY
jgi:hypothetical protein